ncbi:MlaD family protein [Mycolicibacterium bacteremicum]|uniref:Mammalian cell entry related domain protein n=1 Tax=Mycolicibacterium bacteremicum TaxID=564198 RepID=A0A1W9YWW7_MYCBA|nr:MlaD family protein [Mycolicibacterium bacteremicum]MCV7431597.1 Mammalian cell entry related domain protein [Mycolicibacterium bacteremicum]ORA04422.1 Mammalian cell entry related domain protein [Mycolicibacterium bacteremicum]
MTADAEARRLRLVGAILLSCCALVVTFLVVNPFRGRPADLMSVALTVPYLGQGVTDGTPMMMHGVEVGTITSVTNLSSGQVRIDVDLQTTPTQGLTDAFEIDFRTANYFGVTGVNITPGAGGNALRDGASFTTMPKGNYTLQTLLYRLGEITGGVVTPQLIQVIDRATRYTDGLTPLVETMVVVAEAVTDVQTVTTEQLLRHAAGVSVAVPGLVKGISDAGWAINQRAGFATAEVTARESLLNHEQIPVLGEPLSAEYWDTRARPTFEVIAGKFFGAVGTLVSSHSTDLAPAVSIVKTLTDTVPGLVAPEDIGASLTELRSRFEKMYAGSPEQRALQVHIMLDNLPGVAAPINAMGGVS